MCERELDALLGLTINVKKSCCLRIGARYNVMCQPLYSMAGTSLPWVTEIKFTDFTEASSVYDTTGMSI